MTDRTPLPPSAIALAELARKQGFPSLAKRVGVGEAMLRHAASGRRTPSIRLRARLAKAYSLPFDGWITPSAVEGAHPPSVRPSSSAKSASPTRAPGATAPPAAPSEANSGPPRGRTLLDRYRDLAAGLEAELDRARKDPGTATRDIAALGQALARTLAHIGRMTGEHEISEAMVLRHPAFARAIGVLREALRPFPDATRAAASAVSKMNGLANGGSP